MRLGRRSSRRITGFPRCAHLSCSGTIAVAEGDLDRVRAAVPIEGRRTGGTGGSRSRHSPALATSCRFPPRSAGSRRASPAHPTSRATQPWRSPPRIASQAGRLRHYGGRPQTRLVSPAHGVLPRRSRGFPDVACDTARHHEPGQELRPPAGERDGRSKREQGRGRCGGTAATAEWVTGSAGGTPGHPRPACWRRPPPMS